MECEGMMICNHNANSICPNCYKDYMNSNKEQPKMTREEFMKRVSNVKHWSPEEHAKFYEDIGLLKFDEPKKEPTPLYQIDLVPCTDIEHVRLELWSEGLVLRVGRKIV